MTADDITEVTPIAAIPDNLGERGTFTVRVVPDDKTGTYDVEVDGMIMALDYAKQYSLVEGSAQVGWFEDGRFVARMYFKNGVRV